MAVIFCAQYVFCTEQLFYDLPREVVRIYSAFHPLPSPPPHL
jgi:hypothetical protein